MAENFDNTPVAEATIPVKADLTEFQRAIDDALLEIDRKLAATAEAAAKGFTDKIGSALDDIAQKLDAIIVKADTMGAGGKAQGQQDGKAEQEQSGSGLSAQVRDIATKVDAATDSLNSIEATVGIIAGRMGNG